MATDNVEVRIERALDSLVAAMKEHGISLIEGTWSRARLAKIDGRSVKFEVSYAGPSYSPGAITIQVKVGFTGGRTFRELKSGGFNWDGMVKAIHQMVADHNEEERQADIRVAARQAARDTLEALLDRHGVTDSRLFETGSNGVTFRVTGLTTEQLDSTLPALKQAGIVK